MLHVHNHTPPKLLQHQRFASCSRLIKLLHRGVSHPCLLCSAPSNYAIGYSAAGTFALGSSSYPHPQTHTHTHSRTLLYNNTKHVISTEPFPPCIPHDYDLLRITHVLLVTSSRSHVIAQISGLAQVAVEGFCVFVCYPILPRFRRRRMMRNNREKKKGDRSLEVVGAASPELVSLSRQC